MSTPTEQFTHVWHAEAPRVLAFATRHVGAEAAHDVVAETFLVAWRRWGEVPEPPIGWLLVTARKVIQNRARSARRHRALADRVALLDGVTSYAADSADSALSRREALERLARLDEQHREALLLIAWDGLTGEEAAAVLGIKPATFRRRLSRARAALADPSRAAPATRVTSPTTTAQEVR
ncbi:sigma-70 family RNA polymerase sigma factor [Nocardioides sp. zg-536]|uniref:Sigma-70 family RNA polymerase sigma factor n=1 Tax=Nocardioides faecalis TaxID=2803858 RepID=A0A938YC32_9ACTN|nr:sigma-70 family RNA polymerase sigma factor [Nocardioides faecalis]MBM9461089.1 sigma-70 family RNA polymerase sigma factor [Nocardioides faecalis]QVI59169.1 sigma-70 family RNA polymerase sigma factor [Nocardioides faecalis]